MQAHPGLGPSVNSSGSQAGQVSWVLPPPFMVRLKTLRASKAAGRYQADMPEAA
jgi:hypothetical protein